MPPAFRAVSPTPTEELLGSRGHRRRGTWGANSTAPCTSCQLSQSLTGLPPGSVAFRAPDPSRQESVIQAGGAEIRVAVTVAGNHWKRDTSSGGQPHWPLPAGVSDRGDQGRPPPPAETRWHRTTTGPGVWGTGMAGDSFLPGGEVSAGAAHLHRSAPPWGWIRNLSLGGADYPLWCRPNHSEACAWQCLKASSDALQE